MNRKIIIINKKTKQFNSLIKVYRFNYFCISGNLKLQQHNEFNLNFQIGQQLCLTMYVTITYQNIMFLLLIHVDMEREQLKYNELYTTTSFVSYNLV